jgi:AcrR family transcriptional regulator
MPPTAKRPATTRPKRRADAERSVAAILDATVEALADDPDASVSAIARRAGVVRATVYVHFPTREDLIAAVTERAIGEASEAIARAQPTEGDPAAALERMLRTSWRSLGRYHALVAINMRLGHESMHRLHVPVLSLVRPLLSRGQDTGVFNPELPVDWMLTVLLELVHAASLSVTNGTLPAPRAEQVLVETTLGAFSAAPSGQRG